MTHVETARTEGAKAGFRQYVARLATFGEGTAQAKALDALLSAGNQKAQFAYYCELFGDKFANGNAAATQERSDDQRQAAIEAILADEDEDEVGVQVVKPSIVKRVARKAGRKGKVGVGTTFTYKGKTEWEIVGEGTTKRHKKPAWVAVNANGREVAWNKKSVARYIDQGTITL